MHAQSTRTHHAPARAVGIGLAWVSWVVLVACLAATGCGRKKEEARKDARGRDAKEGAVFFRAAMDNRAAPAELSSGETYKKIHEHPFIPAGIVPFSTFSVDVDTAAYSNVRRFLNDGARPPKDAVRIEEMINYFSYDYRNHDAKHPVNLHAEMAACPWNAKHLLARIAIQAQRVEEGKRPPMNLVFLVDTSGSMSSPERLPLLKQGLGMLADKLRPVDRVAIVTYAGDSGIALRSTRGDQTGVIKAALSRLGAGGSTHGSAGIELAYKLCEAHFIKDGINRVILGTDGDFNVGVTSHEGLVKLIEAKRKTGIYLTVLGFGMGNLKDNTMESLAEHGNGHYAYIDTVEEARRVMVEKIGHMQAVARDVKIQVEFNTSKVLYYRLIGYDNRLLAKEDFDDDAKDAGDMGAGQQVTAIYEIIPKEDATEEPKDKDGVTGRAAWGEAMMKVNLRYIPPADKTSVLLVRPLERNDQPLAKASVDFRFAAAVAAFGMVLRETPERGAASYEMAAELAHGARATDPGGYRAEFLTLIEKAKRLR
jgi:Ca-activated chloride channel family protein